MPLGAEASGPLPCPLSSALPFPAPLCPHRLRHLPAIATPCSWGRRRCNCHCRFQCASPVHPDHCPHHPRSVPLPVSYAFRLPGPTLRSESSAQNSALLTSPDSVDARGGSRRSGAGSFRVCMRGGDRAWGLGRLTMPGSSVSTTHPSACKARLHAAPAQLRRVLRVRSRPSQA